MTPKEHLKQQIELAKGYDFTLVVPPGTDSLPLAERIHIYLHVFESGCSVSQRPIGDGKPESCPECVRAFVDAVRYAVDEEIAADPLNAVLRMARATTGACPACGEKDGAHKEGCEPAFFGTQIRMYTPPEQEPLRCLECGQYLSHHTPGCPNSFTK